MASLSRRARSWLSTALRSRSTSPDTRAIVKITPATPTTARATNVACPADSSPTTITHAPTLNPRPAAHEPILYRAPTRST